MFRGLAIPGKRLRIVLLDDKSKVVQLTDLEFSRRVSLSGSLAEPFLRLSRVVSAVVQHRAERKLRNDVAGIGLGTGCRHSLVYILVCLRAKRGGAHETGESG